MALKKFERRRCPTDGTPFRTLVNLHSVLDAAWKPSDEEMNLPDFCVKTWLPAWVRMEQYKAQVTRDNPSGMRFGPVVRLGDVTSPELAFHGRGYDAGLSTDYAMFGDNYDGTSYIYHPIAGDDSPGEDASQYECDICNHTLYRDDLSLRYNGSAMMRDGTIICRDCEAIGLVTDADTCAQLERCKALAKFLGGDAEESLNRNLVWLGHKSAFASPSQTRLWKSDKWSFDFLISCIAPGQPARRRINGGLIQHGPTPILGDDGGYTFRQWDYKQNIERDATPEEVGNITWSTHT